MINVSIVIIYRVKNAEAVIKIFKVSDLSPGGTMILSAISSGFIVNSKAVKTQMNLSIRKCLN